MNTTSPAELRAELALLMAESERLHAALDGVAVRVAEIVHSLSDQRARQFSDQPGWPHPALAA